MTHRPHESHDVFDNAMAVLADAGLIVQAIPDEDPEWLQAAA